MATEILDHPSIPEAIQQSVGQSARARLDILDHKMNELELRGDIKPATILNLSPFVLDLCSGLIQYKIRAAPIDKPFHAQTITTCISYPKYLGNKQMSDKSIQKNYDVNILLPIMQLMEFKHQYIGESQEDVAFKQGGVVIFEGDAEGLKPDTEVRAPSFVFRKRNRYIVFEMVSLKELVQSATEIMRQRCMASLDQASRWYDNEKQRANIQRAEHTWHDFALRKQWITSALAWRNVQAPESSRCPRCAQQYVSKTGVCKCSFVYEPFTAYMQGEITVDHVRMNTLSKAQWEKVKTEQKRRDEARA